MVRARKALPRVIGQFPMLLPKLPKLLFAVAAAAVAVAAFVAVVIR